MRSALALSLGALLVAGSAHTASAGEVLREESRATVPAAGLTKVRIHNARGSVEVRPSRDGAIHVRALKTARAQTLERARSLARLTGVETETRAGTWRLEAVYPQGQRERVGLRELLGGYELPSVQLRFLVEVPAALALEVETASGDVVTEDVRGEQSLESSSGDVTATGALGPCAISTSSGDVVASAGARMRIQTASGDVRVERAAAPLQVTASSGDIDIAGAEDSLRVQTSSGDISVVRAPKGLRAGTTSGDLHVESASGALSVETGSGGIDIGLSASAGPIQLTTSSGELVARLARGLRADLEATTSSGTIETDLPVEVNEVNRHRVSGRIGGGGATVRLKSGSGDIRILTGGK